ncbi:MAG: adenylosuccinate synthase [Candidatus Cloacimonetes bacterium]|nr:adenylosuccinate synthase [Candidatus Cloacimonadota bacterium]
MSTTAVLGCMWGDEGKAKITDVLASDAHAVVRFQGGANAGHTIWLEGAKFVFNTVPSGLLYPDVICILGAGMVIDPFQLLQEMNTLRDQGLQFEGRFFISPRAPLVLPLHKTIDAGHENDANRVKIGTTKRGIGPAYADRTSRVNLLFGDLFDEEALRAGIANLHRHHYGEVRPIELEETSALLREAAARLEPCLAPTIYMMHEMYSAGKNILFEGAQGSLLDVGLGTYPFVTSSHTTMGGIATGSGFPTRRIDRIVGVYKSYFTRVGEGPFVTELHDETGQRIRDRGHEYGTVSGRPRRCGWFDAVAARYTALINGLDEIAFTLLDVLSGFDTLKVCTAYRIDGEQTGRFPAGASALNRAEPVFEDMPGWQEDITGITRFDDLPQAAQQYVQAIERLVGVPVSIVSVGPDRNQTIFRS